MTLEYWADLNYVATNWLTPAETKEAGQYQKVRLRFLAKLNPELKKKIPKKRKGKK